MQSSSFLRFRRWSSPASQSHHKLHARCLSRDMLPLFTRGPFPASHQAMPASAFAQRGNESEYIFSTQESLVDNNWAEIADHIETIEELYEVIV